MISVIIPALNEAATIASVVEFARHSPRVSEVIVVDDGSTDATAELARGAGAHTITTVGRSSGLGATSKFTLIATLTIAPTSGPAEDRRVPARGARTCRRG